MRRMMIISLIVILTFAVPYGVMQYKGTFTLASYGNVLCYVGMAHIIIALMNVYNVSDLNSKMTKSYIYSNNLINNLEGSVNKIEYNKLGSILFSVFLLILGIGTIYLGYKLTL